MSKTKSKKTEEAPSRPGWETCAKCKGLHPEHRFRLLTVRTLPIRDMGGERKVQALGEFEDGAICTSCAQECLSQRLHPLRPLLKKLFPFLLIGLCGVLLALFFFQRDQVFFLLGLAAVACCILGIYGTSREALRKKQEFLKMSPKEALRGAAYDTLISCMPKKGGEEDLTYIPVESSTFTRKKGDLMVLYDLLPDIAVQANERILADKDNRPKD